MSNLRDMPALPTRAVDRIFARFVAMFGVAAVQRMWGCKEDELGAIKGVWADSLGRFSLEQILAGLRALEDSGATFPPTLPEFVALCKRRPPPVVAAHQPFALPAPRTDGDIAAARDKVERLVATVGREPKHDPAEWAYTVIRRYRGGDKGVADCSYRFALEALTNLGREIPA